jgi:hypothetical protein
VAILGAYSSELERSPRKTTTLLSRQIFNEFTLAQILASPKRIDSTDEIVWTILGFLNPVWNARDGGEFFFEDYKIECKSGRFVVFPSRTQHDGGYVKNEQLNYWRVAVSSSGSLAKFTAIRRASS